MWFYENNLIIDINIRMLLKRELLAVSILDYLH